MRSETLRYVLEKNVGLLAYSPLGFGVLSGKYLNGELPMEADWKLFPNSRFAGIQSMKATEQYMKVAKKYKMSLTFILIFC